VIEGGLKKGVMETKRFEWALVSCEMGKASMFPHRVHMLQHQRLAYRMKPDYLRLGQRTFCALFPPAVIGPHGMRWPLAVDQCGRDGISTTRIHGRDDMSTTRIQLNRLADHTCGLMLVMSAFSLVPCVGRCIVPQSLRSTWRKKTKNRYRNGQKKTEKAQNNDNAIYFTSRVQQS